MAEVMGYITYSQNNEVFGELANTYVSVRNLGHSEF